MGNIARIYIHNRSNILPEVQKMIGPQIPKELREKREKERREKSTGKGGDSVIQEQRNEAPNNVVKESNTENGKDERDSSDSEDSDSDDIMGPSLPGTHTSEVETKLSLMQLHQEKLKSSGIDAKNKITKYDSKKGLNDEIKKEMLRKLNMAGGLKGKFTSGLT